MFTLQFTAVNNSPGQRIILQAVLAVFKRKYRLWLYINSQWPGQKNDISGSIRHKSFIQTVEILFPR